MGVISGLSFQLTSVAGGSGAVHMGGAGLVGAEAGGRGTWLVGKGKTHNSRLCSEIISELINPAIIHVDLNYRRKRRKGKCLGVINARGRTRADVRRLLPAC